MINDIYYRTNRKRRNVVNSNIHLYNSEYLSVLGMVLTDMSFVTHLVPCD